MCHFISLIQSFSFIGRGADLQVFSFPFSCHESTSSHALLTSKQYRPLNPLSLGTHDSSFLHIVSHNLHEYSSFDFQNLVVVIFYVPQSSFSRPLQLLLSLKTVF